MRALLYKESEYGPVEGYGIRVDLADKDDRKFAELLDLDKTALEDPEGHIDLTVERAQEIGTRLLTEESKLAQEAGRCLLGLIDGEHAFRAGLHEHPYTATVYENKYEIVVIGAGQIALAA